jgi:2-dehydrotetronate isomerase
MPNSNPKFAANLSMLYPELDFVDRFAAAASDGFKAVEYLFPYQYHKAQLAKLLQDNGLQQVLFNAPPGGGDQSAAIDAAWNAGERGTACVPGQEDHFKSGVLLALDYAKALSCPRIHLMAGLIPEGMTYAQMLPTYISNLKWAAQEAQRVGIDVLIEPINTRDIPRFFLNRQDQAHAIIEQLGLPNIKVQMDLYHCQIVEGDVAMKIRQYLPTGRVGHLQIAGVPQRHEPDIGEVNYDYLFSVLAQVSAECGFDGWVGCEYRPARGTVAGGTSAGLGWFKKQPR